MTEIAAMRYLMMQKPSSYHPNVIRLLDVFQDDDYLFMVMPYLSGGDLLARLEAAGEEGIPKAEALCYFRQMVNGLLFMKQHHIAHHDVSLENVVISEVGGSQVKIIDFGMSIMIPKTIADEAANKPVYTVSEPSRGKLGYVVSGVQIYK